MARENCIPVTVMLPRWLHDEIEALADAEFCLSVAVSVNTYTPATSPVTVVVIRLEGFVMVAAGPLVLTQLVSKIGCPGFS